MKFLKALLGLVVFAALGVGAAWVIMRLVGLAVAKLAALDPTVAAGLITAFATIVVSIGAITLGRYFERRRELIAVHRDKKVIFYDEFLHKWFDLTRDGAAEERPSTEMVEFLRDLQRKLILWSGPGVLKTYTDWSRMLQSGPPTAKAMFKMEEFYFAIRRDLGQSNRGLKRGDLIRLTMKHPEFFMSEAEKNPDVTLEALAELEKGLTQRR